MVVVNLALVPCRFVLMEEIIRLEFILGAEYWCLVEGTVIGRHCHVILAVNAWRNFCLIRANDFDHYLHLQSKVVLKPDAS